MGYSLEKLANLSGIGRSTLGNYELGKTKMSPEKLAHLAACLKTTEDDLLPLPENRSLNERFQKGADNRSLNERFQKGDPGTPPESPPPAGSPPTICRIPEGCDLPGQLAEVMKQLVAMQAEMNELRKAFVSLLAAEQAQPAAADPNAVKPEEEKKEKAG